MPSQYSFGKNRTLKDKYSAFTDGQLLYQLTIWEKEKIALKILILYFFNSCEAFYELCTIEGDFVKGHNCEIYIILYLE